MSKQVKLRRGTTSEHATFTGALGEVTVDTTKDVAVVHDGATAGGVPLAREDRPRGWVKTEVFTAIPTSTWTQTGKTDLKRIRVTAYGGGAGGAGGSGGSGGGGGAGGIGIVTLEASSVTTNVTVTVGAGGANNVAGGTTSFGAYIVATGGGTATAGGNPDGGQSYNGGAGGTASGTGVTILGGAGGGFGYSLGGSSAVTYIAYGSNTYSGGQGGGLGGGPGVVNGGGAAAKGITGSGGGANAAGAQGCVIVEEIYGLY
jgi:hypothetical protein